MLATQIRKYIQEPILDEVGWKDSASLVLVYGTGYVETSYSAIMQYGTPENGGLGFYQTQPSDYFDIQNWMHNNFNANLLQKVLVACNYSNWPSDPMSLVHNIAFATLVCRLHYFRIKEPLPDAKDAEGMAKYHFKYYNGNGLGKADVERNTGIFERIIHDEI